MARRNNGPRIRWFPERGAYYIVWSENGRSKERSTGTRDRDQAEAALADFIQDRRRELGKLIPANQLLITEVMDAYLLEAKMEPESKERASYAVVALTEFWTGKSVADVDKDSCDKYGESRVGRSDGTIRKELGVMRAAINHAADARRLKDRVKVFLPDEPDSRQRWLTREEAASLLRKSLRLPKSRPYLPLFIVTGLHTGQRKEAILGLRWSQVDLVKKRIDWQQPGRKRTKKTRPHTRMPSKLLPHLKRAYKIRGDCEYVINLDGKRLDDVKSSFSNACRKALLAGVSPHTLRHTRATWGMQAGANKWELAGFLGMTLETLQNVYGHHHPDHQKEGADRYGPSRARKQRSDDNE